VILSECFFVQNYGPALFPQTWSLAVEEHFYLLLPLFLLLIRTEAKDPFKGLPAKFLIVTLLLTAARLLNADLRPVFHYKTHLFPTHLRIDSLFFGVLLGYFYQWYKEQLWSVVARSRFPLGLLACVAPIPAMFLSFDSAPFLSTLNPNLLYLGFGALLLLALRYSPKFAPVEWIGKQSYTIYLWHIPVRFFGLGWLPARTNPALHLLLYFSLSIMVGALAAKLIETPCLALRNRLFPSRIASDNSPPVSPAAPESTKQFFPAMSPHLKG
jgi:peptidoglycan/LPS O-acetylase OafA/YrhL